MSTFSKVVNVTATSYATAPDIEFPFEPKLVTAQNLDGGDVAYVSFDGRTDAAGLLNNPLAPASTHRWEWQYNRKLWLQTGGSAVLVQIIAES
jgi:hypothetical protein